MDSRTCMKCRGMNLKRGHLTFPGTCSFIPEGGTAVSFKNQVVPGNLATVCLDCGFLEVSCDPETVKAVIKSVDARAPAERIRLQTSRCRSCGNTPGSVRRT